MRKNVSLIVQGRWDEANIRKINSHYSKFTNDLIFSVWENEFRNDVIDDTIVVLNKESEIEGLFQGANYHRQIVSTLNGMKVAKNEYAIKLRTDEYYEKIDTIIERTLDSKKFITSDVWLRKDRECKFHISDHFFAGKTSNLLKAMQDVKEALGRIKQLNFNPNLNVSELKIGDHGGIEAWITIALLNSIGVIANPEKSIELMLENFEVIQSKQLGKHVVKWNNMRQTFENYDIMGNMSFEEYLKS